ncbi:hypothetical protein [Dokdonella immobilis]|uniref:CVNH domain-containing protein n=1 Tax=Dokdonella immobilis TaxID=578942 RepID=A0A1I4X9A6_9GAMM|nr:hypothetical protein [Dokdonella immobilis]SFN22365.1 hypothetical protein SAMN05216289_108111 [Dokdonella immobilis]
MDSGFRFASILTSVVLAGVSALTLARANSSGGQQICDGRYALCSSAACSIDAKDPQHATCRCEGPLDGLNIGDSTCQSRAATLTSTFSVWDLTRTAKKAAKHSLACTGEDAGVWAFCLDAPCAVHADGSVTCHCTMSEASDYYTFTDACPADAKARHAACGRVWSAALQAELLSGYSQLWSFYADIPKLEYCPVR